MDSPHDWGVSSPLCRYQEAYAAEDVAVAYCGFSIGFAATCAQLAVAVKCKVQQVRRGYSLQISDRIMQWWEQDYIILNKRQLSGTSFFFRSRKVLIPTRKATGRFFTSGVYFLHWPCKKSWFCVKKCN